MNIHTAFYQLAFYTQWSYINDVTILGREDEEFSDDIRYKIEDQILSQKLRDVIFEQPQMIYNKVMTHSISTLRVSLKKADGDLQNF